MYSDTTASENAAPPSSAIIPAISSDSDSAKSSGDFPALIIITARPSADIDAAPIFSRAEYSEYSAPEIDAAIDITARSSVIPASIPDLILLIAPDEDHALLDITASRYSADCAIPSIISTAIITAIIAAAANPSDNITASIDADSIVNAAIFITVVIFALFPCRLDLLYSFIPSSTN